MSKHEIPEAAGPGSDFRAARSSLALALLFLVFSMSGCRLFETRESEAPPAPAAPAPEPIAKADLPTAMGYLEDGRGDAARELLAELAEDAPGSPVVASLLRQIDEPVEQLLPGPYRQVEVDVGESLSLIAARELGDPLMFYALARLNGIEIPARVPAGTILRVPETAETGGDHDLASSDSVESPSEVTVADVESVARYLARNGQNDQARSTLIGRLREGDGADSTRELLASLTQAHAAEMRARGAFAPAIEAIEEALEILDGSIQGAALANQRDAIRSQMLREDALRLRNRGELVEAYRVAQEAANLDPDTDEALGLVDELQKALVDSLHNEALVAWRDRNVDLAIRTWESLLEAVPDFEPAQVYLDRARRLRERLDEP